jgi:3-oxocholest-4-en-26-oyl-CoA dehydrogenase beta subunit
VDFSFSPDQQEVRDLASRIFGDLSTHERLKELEAAGGELDRKLWDELASAGLLGLELPEAVGGAGLGFVETCIVLEEAGRHAAAVPLIATLVLGAGPISRFGSAEQQARWLEPVASGSQILTGALVEPGGDLRIPTTTARRDGDGWRLEGSKVNVPAVVVPAATEGGIGLFVVDTGADGVTRRPQETTSGHREAEVELSGVVVGDDAVLVEGDAGQAALEWMIEHATAAVCIAEAGICEAAVKLTASYTSERVQFEKVIATFQAVGQRAADAFIDAEAVRLTAWQAAWRLAEGKPAAAEVAIAKFWADDGAQRVVHAAQHLHGGVGVDRDYPLHRYYLLTKQYALTLGGANASLSRLGDLMAEQPA